jgi:hypothetical protein
VRGRGIDEIHKVQSPSLRVIRTARISPAASRSGQRRIYLSPLRTPGQQVQLQNKYIGDYPRRSIIGGRRGQAYRHHLWEWSGLMLQPPRAESEKEGTATEERSSCVPRSHQCLNKIHGLRKTPPTNSTSYTAGSCGGVARFLEPLPGAS